MFCLLVVLVIVCQYRASDWLERIGLRSDLYYVLMGTLNPTNSLTHSPSVDGKILAREVRGITKNCSELHWGGVKPKFGLEHYPLCSILEHLLRLWVHKIVRNWLGVCSDLWSRVIITRCSPTALQWATLQFAPDNIAVVCVSDCVEVGHRHARNPRDKWVVLPRAGDGSSVW